MNLLILVVVVIFYASVGGCVVSKLMTYKIRSDTLEQLPPPNEEVSLPPGQVDAVAIQQLSIRLAIITMPPMPLIDIPADTATVHPVIVLHMDGTGLWLALTNDGVWQSVPLATLIPMTPTDYPADWNYSSGDITPAGQPVSIEVSDNLLDWQPLATVNVSSNAPASFVDMARDFYQGAAFYRASQQ